MQYLITFLEGIITFVSPCLLPLLPVYISFFAGGAERNSAKTIKRGLGFILGFTVVFVSMGAAAGFIGNVLKQYQVWVNIITGLIIIFFGVIYLGIFKWNPFNSSKGPSLSGIADKGGFISAFIFGLVFSVSWTPCVGTFLGSALALASGQGSTIKGIVLLLCYSAGLGIPFMICALIIDKLKSALNWIKSHYQIINKVCGVFLIIIGILVATGLLGKWIALLS